MLKWNLQQGGNDFTQRPPSSTLGVIGQVEFGATLRAFFHVRMAAQIIATIATNGRVIAYEII